MGRKRIGRKRKNKRLINAYIRRINHRNNQYGGISGKDIRQFLKRIKII